jgi:succinate dehydrogenase / fumarate reductase flavoprotein subunit
MELQERMQDLVGIVRTETEMLRALDVLTELRRRTARVGAGGNREYNAGWHTALDLPNLLTVSEAVTRAGLERRESRGAHFREDCPEKVDQFGQLNIIISKGPDGRMAVTRRPIPEMPPELKQVIEENK